MLRADAGEPLAGPLLLAPLLPAASLHSFTHPLTRLRARSLPPSITHAVYALLSNLKIDPKSGPAQRQTAGAPARVNIVGLLVGLARRSRLSRMLVQFNHPLFGPSISGFFFFVCVSENLALAFVFSPPFPLLSSFFLSQTLPFAPPVRQRCFNHTICPDICYRRDHHRHRQPLPSLPSITVTSP